MSLGGFRWVWQHADEHGLSPWERLVLLALAESAHAETGRAYPGAEELSRRTGISSRTVRRLLASLQSRGVVLQTRRGHRGQRAEYQVPLLHTNGTESRPLTATFNAESRSHTTAFSDQKGGHSEQERWPLTTKKVAPCGRPIPQEPALSRSARENEREAPTAEGRADDPTLTKIYKEEIYDRFGRSPDEHATRSGIIAVFALAGEATITHPEAYLRKAIATDPRKFEPVAMPPKYTRNSHAAAAITAALDEEDRS